MQILNLLPEKLRKSFIQNVKDSGLKIKPNEYLTRNLIISVILAVLISFALIFVKFPVVISFFGIFIFLQLLFFFRLSLNANARIRKMETIFPDLIQFMASNLRAGLTIEKSLTLSARSEFKPLDGEVIKASNEIATGKDVITALLDMSKRINSDKIQKTIRLMISGLKSGGNIASLLEEIAENMREQEFMEKRVSSSVLMYVIFIFFATGVGAPILFGLSSVLVKIIIELLASVDISGVPQASIPFAMTKVSISAEFITYYALIFLIVTDVISCFVMGLIMKGKEKEGLKYVLPLLAASLSIFFLVRTVIGKFFAGAFASVG